MDFYLKQVLKYQDTRLLAEVVKLGNINYAYQLANDFLDRIEYIDVYLVIACKYGHAKIVELLINLGANVNAFDGLPMMIAVSHGHLEVIVRLNENRILDISKTMHNSGYELERIEFVFD